MADLSGEFKKAWDYVGEPMYRHSQDWSGLWSQDDQQTVVSDDDVVINNGTGIVPTRPSDEVLRLLEDLADLSDRLRKLIAEENEKR